MSNISLILLGAGESSRFKTKTKKQWLRIEDKPMWLLVLEKFHKLNIFNKIILTAHKDELNFYKYISNIENCEFISGGSSRQESIQNSLKYINSEFIMISDIARCFIPEDLIFRILELKNIGDVIVPYLSVSDTVVFGNQTINRDEVKLIQTPQLSKTAILKKYINSNNNIFTDESSLIAENGGKRVFVLGDVRAKKITFLSDLKDSECFKISRFNDKIKIGNGVDVHQFKIKEIDQPMKLGGIEIDSPLSFLAHSDGDVLIHSLIDAILGASGLGDIGELFPDNDSKYRGISSVELLKLVKDLIEKLGLEFISADITVLAETPRLKKYKFYIRKQLANILKVDLFNINIKATTTEKLGFIGRKEGLMVLSTATIKNIDWRKWTE